MKSFNQYKNPAIALDLIVFGYHEEQLTVLLLNRKEPPFKNKWTLPGAFLQPDESFLDTSNRILDTKLGISGLFLEQLYSFDALNRDPRGRVISIAYVALINPSRFELIAGQMANDVKWFELQNKPLLGFDHDIIFGKALHRLRSKMLYNPVGFELLDEEFTLPELHRLYETVFDQSLDRRNFRRKILDADYIIPTGEKKTGAQNRHPDLYRFNKYPEAHRFQLNIQIDS